MLKRLIAKAATHGYELKTGVECEFFLTRRTAGASPTPPTPGQALLRPAGADAPLRRHRRDLRRHVGARLEPYQNDHEDANGQFEMNWDYDDALSTADRHAFFKYMVKSIAEKHGLRATFMPKPFPPPHRQRLPRAHLAVGQGRQATCSRDPSGELGLSATGYHFIGGIMHAAEALCAITNPTVNSYKRINAPRTLSGATWSPNTVT